MQISHVSCSTTMLQLKLIVNSPCYNIYLQLFVTLQKVQDVTRKTQNLLYFFWKVPYYSRTKLCLKIFGWPCMSRFGKPAFLFRLRLTRLVIHWTGQMFPCRDTSLFRLYEHLALCRSERGDSIRFIRGGFARGPTPHPFMYHFSQKRYSLV